MKLKNLKKPVVTLATAVAMSFSAVSAMAEEGFRGLSIGVIANDSTFDSVGREEERGGQYITGATQNRAADHTHATVSKNVEYPSFFVEYSFGDTLAMTIGLEHISGTHEIGAKSVTHSASDRDSGADFVDTGTRTGKAEVKNINTIYIEPAVMATDTFGVYGKFGLTHMRVNSVETTNASTYGNTDILGGMYGFGVKAVSSMGIFVKLEGTQTHFNTIELESTTGNRNLIKANTDQESVRLAIGYNF